MPSDEREILVEAFTEMAPDYERKVDSELNLFWGWSYKGFVNELIQKTPIHKNDVILDVATGTGVISHHLAGEGFSQNKIHALDITFPMLKQTRKRFENSKIGEKSELVCASAMEMPYQGEHFTLVICGLATHHMKVEEFLLESHRILASNGRLSIIDVGGSLMWKIPGIKFFVRIIAYIFFMMTESRSRAWAESAAISNIRAKEEWQALLTDTGFKDIKIIKLSSKNWFIPSPLFIQAVKS
jgi:ubiquinone/menaquinone biosynthesis C-methylase UbiE